MKLPKYDLPRFSTILPVSKLEIKYRPYTIKEETVLLLSIQSDDEQESYGAVLQIIENCCSIDVETLHPADVAWLYIKVRSVSRSPIVKIVYTMDKCGQATGCPSEINLSLNMDNVHCEGSEKIEESFKRKSGSFIIPFDNHSGIACKMKTSKILNSEDTFYDTLLDYVYDKDNVYTKSEISREEFSEYLEDLPIDYYNKLEEFFNIQPEVCYNIEFKCPKCGHDYHEEIKGVQNFLEY